MTAHAAQHLGTTRATPWHLCVQAAYPPSPPPIWKAGTCMTRPHTSHPALQCCEDGPNDGQANTLTGKPTQCNRWLRPWSLKHVDTPPPPARSIAAIWQLQPCSTDHCGLKTLHGKHPATPRTPHRQAPAPVGASLTGDQMHCRRWRHAQCTHTRVQAVHMHSCQAQGCSSR